MTEREAERLEMVTLVVEELARRQEEINRDLRARLDEM
jgi:hypothetical protein